MMDRNRIPNDAGYRWHCPDCATLLKEEGETCLCEVEPVPRDSEDPEAVFRRRRQERRERYEQFKVPSRAERTKREMYWGRR